MHDYPHFIEECTFWHEQFARLKECTLQTIQQHTHALAELRSQLSETVYAETESKINQKKQQVQIYTNMGKLLLSVTALSRATRGDGTTVYTPAALRVNQWANGQEQSELGGIEDKNKSMKGIFERIFREVDEPSLTANEIIRLVQMRHPSIETQNIRSALAYLSVSPARQKAKYSKKPLLVMEQGAYRLATEEDCIQTQIDLIDPA